MASRVEIWNMALGNLGQSDEVNDPDEDTNAANACRRFWDADLESELQDFKWSFAVKQLALAEVEEDPTEEWSFSYTYPSDCAIAKRILSGTRTETLDSEIAFEIVNDDSGSKIIYTDMEDAVLEYVKQEDDTTIYPAYFRKAMSYKLAFSIAPSLISGSPNYSSIRREMFELYSQFISRAKKNNANEVVRGQPPDSEFTRNR